jgi:uncharacterized membrane protein SirB2
VLAICSTCMFFMALDMPFTVCTMALLICCMRMAVSWEKDRKRERDFTDTLNHSNDLLLEALYTKTTYIN